MRRIVGAVIVAWLAVFLVRTPPAQAAGPEVLDDQSRDLTNYLHDHRLPLVGAQVMSDQGGVRQLVLYGFVATASGKQDAVVKSRGFLKDAGIQVTNRVKVRPELLTMKQGATADGPASDGAGAPASPEGASPNDVNNYQSQGQQGRQASTQQQQQRYMNQPPGLLGSIAPLLGLGNSAAPLSGLGGAVMGLGGLGGSHLGAGAGTSSSYTPYLGSSNGSPSSGYGGPNISPDPP